MSKVLQKIYFLWKKHLRSLSPLKVHVMSKILQNCTFWEKFYGKSTSFEKKNIKKSMTYAEFHENQGPVKKTESLGKRIFTSLKKSCPKHALWKNPQKFRSLKMYKQFLSLSWIYILSKIPRPVKKSLRIQGNGKDALKTHFLWKKTTKKSKSFKKKSMACKNPLKSSFFRIVRPIENPCPVEKNPVQNWKIQFSLKKTLKMSKSFKSPCHVKNPSELYVLGKIS